MRVRMDYGKTGLEAELPDANLRGVLGLSPAKPLYAPVEAVEQSLREPIGTKPLAELAAGKANACIVICDITRPVPNKPSLPPLLRTLEAAGIARENITHSDCHRNASSQRRRRTGGAGRGGDRRDLSLSSITTVTIWSRTVSGQSRPTAFPSGWTRPIATRT